MNWPQNVTTIGFDNPAFDRSSIDSELAREVHLVDRQLSVKLSDLMYIDQVGKILSTFCAHLFCTKILAQKLLIKCWWNWLQIGKILFLKADLLHPVYASRLGRVYFGSCKSFKLGYDVFVSSVLFHIDISCLKKVKFN